MATKAPSKNGKPKQQHFEGMTPDKDAKLERLADRYVEKRDERMRLGDEEAAAKTLLHVAMKEKGIPRYEYDGRFIEITLDENVKVGKIKKTKENADA